MEIYNEIIAARAAGKKCLAVLIDPDKFTVAHTQPFVAKIEASAATHIFVGGSIVDAEATGVLVAQIKRYTQLPVVLFPGDVTQITEHADALLFLTLLSGRNPEYLIGKHVAAVSKLRTMALEVISTGYILVESGNTTAVAKVTGTAPLARHNAQYIVDTAKAGELLGAKLMYLEAGSGAASPIPVEVISAVKSELDIPLIVGGGIRTKTALEAAFRAGATLVVIGTALEEDEMFFSDLNL
jgi:putative glycerol-1-phosphate prenyltransferase